MRCLYVYNWLVLSDEQMSKIWQFSILNGEQMSNRVGVKHLPDKYVCIVSGQIIATSHDRFPPNGGEK